MDKLPPVNVPRATPEFNVIILLSEYVIGANGLATVSLEIASCWIY
jgi:hypothetical protein